MSVSVSSLKAAGFQVRINHYRVFEESPETMLPIHIGHALGYKTISPRGGITTATIITTDGDSITAAAKCSAKDNFCRKTGLNIAVNRAFGKLSKL